MKTPMATDVDATKAIAASPPILFSSLNFKIKKEAPITIGIETISGDEFSKSAKATVAKLTWAKPSPIIEYLRNTKNIPKKELLIAIRDPTMNARCKNGKVNNSSMDVMFMFFPMTQGCYCLCSYLINELLRGTYFIH